MTSRGVALVCVFATSVAQTACSESHRPGNFHLATVAASPEHGLLFIAQPGFEAVDVLRIPRPGERNTAPAFVTRLADARRTHIVRLSVDRDRGRLWVADFGLVQVYGLPGLDELRRYELPKGKYYERFSDFALDNSGNVFVLSRGGARIYRIDARSLDLEAWLEVDHQAADTALLLANRVLKSPDDRHLFLPSPSKGQLLQVDMRSKQVIRLTGSAANLTCGLLFWDSDSAGIRAFDCTGRWEAQIELAGEARTASVALRGEPRLAGTVTSFDR